MHADMERDRYFTGAEAVAYGLADRVIEHRTGTRRARVRRGLSGRARPPTTGRSRRRAPALTPCSRHRAGHAPPATARRACGRCGANGRPRRSDAPRNEGGSASAPLLGQSAPWPRSRRQLRSLGVSDSGPARASPGAGRRRSASRLAEERLQARGLARALPIRTSPRTRPRYATPERSGLRARLDLAAALLFCQRRPRKQGSLPLSPGAVRQRAVNRAWNHVHLADGAAAARYNVRN